MEGYIYLGELYDVLGRELSISDKKIGLSKEPVNREYQLNRTKSPIGYKIITAFKVDNMFKVEKMLHAILDSRRVFGEWFKDDEDNLTGEFINFMTIYGGQHYDLAEAKSIQVDVVADTRLQEVAKKFGKDTPLVRNYLGVDYDVILTKNGMLQFNGELFDTPNKLYNNGIVKFVKGKKGNSGTNNTSQFIVKETGLPLSSFEEKTEMTVEV
jgi:hypothetical protein